MFYPFKTGFLICIIFNMYQVVLKTYVSHSCDLHISDDKHFLKKTTICLQRERRQKESFSQMAATSGPGRSQELHLCLPHGWQVPKPLGQVLLLSSELEEQAFGQAGFDTLTFFFNELSAVCPAHHLLEYLDCKQCSIPWFPFHLFPTWAR